MADIGVPMRDSGSSTAEDIGSLPPTAAAQQPQQIHATAEGDPGAPPRKPKKTKEQRRCPRKRRSKKRDGNASRLPRGPGGISYGDDGDDYSGEEDDDQQDDRLFSAEGRSSHGSSDSLFDPVLSSWFKEMKAKRLEGRASPSLSPRPVHASELSDRALIHSNVSSAVPKSPTIVGVEDETRFFFEIQKERSGQQKIQQLLQQGGDDDDLAAEQAERERWRAWALHAAEMERRRRMRILEEIDMEQERERQARRQWAIEAIEREKQERIAAQFLSNLTSTNWFNDAITAYHEDYELVCPYYKLGCKVSCRRSTVQRHLKKCRFAIEYNAITSNSTTDENSYEVVCPNSILGCTYTGCLKDLTNHLAECTFLGRTVQQEREERQQMMKHVIMECEEERARRVQSDDYVVTIRKSEDRIPSRLGYRAHSGEGDGPSSTTTSLLRGAELIAVPVLPPQRQSKSGRSLSEASSESIGTRRISERSSMGQGEENDRSVSNSTPPLPPPAFEPVRSLDTNTHSGSINNTQYEIDSSDFSDSGMQQTRTAVSKKPSLQRLLEEQKRTIIAALHREAAQLWVKVQSFRRAREEENNSTIAYLNNVVKEMWPFAEVRAFGSFESGLYSLSSDMDLVVCFADQYKSLPTVTGVAPLLQNLAEWLLLKASDSIVIRKVLLHSAVPIIKADVKRSLLRRWRKEGGGGVTNSNSPNSNSNSSSTSPSTSSLGSEDDEYQSIDISIDAPSHSGMATTAFVKQMLTAYPVIGPAVCLLKTFLKSKGLGDPYSGGLSPYGLFLLVLLLKQQRETIHASVLQHSPATKSSAMMPRGIADTPRGGVLSNSSSDGSNAAISIDVDFKKGGAVTVADLSLSPHKTQPDSDAERAILRIRSRSRSDLDASKFIFPMSLSSHDSPPGPSPTAGAIGSTSTSTNGSSSSTSSSTSSSNSGVSSAVPPSPSSAFSPRRQQLARGLSSDNIGTKQVNDRSRAGPRPFVKSNKKRASFHLTWTGLEQQIDFGKRVAEKLLEGRSGSMRIRGLSVTSEAENIVRFSSNGSASGQDLSVPHDLSLDLADGELGSLLIEFLEYFGEGWDDEKIGFSVRDGGFKFDLSTSAGMPSHPQADDPFVIEDPVNVINNVARTCYNVNSVMRSIQEAHTRYRASVVRLGTRIKMQSSSGKHRKKTGSHGGSEDDESNITSSIVSSTSTATTTAPIVLREAILETIPEISAEIAITCPSEPLDSRTDSGALNNSKSSPKKGNVIRAARRIEMAVASHTTSDTTSTSGTTDAAILGFDSTATGAKASVSVARKMDPIESVIREIFELNIEGFSAMDNRL